jgi:hypothetical protein
MPLNSPEQILEGSKVVMPPSALTASLRSLMSVQIMMLCGTPQLLSPDDLDFETTWLVKHNYLTPKQFRFGPS